MEYYDPIDHTSKRYAAVITVVVMALVSLAVSYVTIDVNIIDHEQVVIEVEYLEEEVAEEHTPPTPVTESKVQNPKPQPTPAYENVSTQNTRNQTSGNEQTTQTVNEQALFKPSVGVTTDEQVVDGNRLAPKAESESHQGEHTGLNVIGDVEFDGGLAGRGVVAGYPRPSGNNAVGRVVVSVVVDSDGNVIEAYIRAQGTTTTDTGLRANALNAARRTKFRPDPSRMTQSGTISYKYIVN